MASPSALASVLDEQTAPPPNLFGMGQRPTFSSMYPTVGMNTPPLPSASTPWYGEEPGIAANLLFGLRDMALQANQAMPWGGNDPSAIGIDTQAGTIDPSVMVPFATNVAGMATTGSMAAPPVAGVGMGVRSYRGNWRNDRPMTYNDDYFDIVPDKLLDDAGNVLAEKDRLIPKSNLIDRIPTEPQEGVIYRGMSAAEFEDFQKTGRIQSNGLYNIGDDQVGLTYFTTDPRSAQSYSNAFAPKQHKPTYEKPAYVVAVKAPSASRTRRVEGTGEHEVGVIGEIPASDVVAVYRGNVVQHDPGVTERGVSVAPSSWLHWEQLSSNPKESAALGAAILGGQEKRGIRAYHGSPHDFDRFSMDKIGTGEGAQAYGHGLYFAENPGVAKSYKPDIAASDAYVTGPALDVAELDYGRGLTREAERLFVKSGNAEDAIKTAIENGDQDIAEIITKWRDDGYLHDRVASGRMYEVDIDASPDEFLDWDKPLSEQPRKIRDALASIEGGDMYREALSPMEQKATRGETIMRMIGRDADAAEALRAAGIKGIRYKDAGSRYHPSALPDNPIANEARKWLEQTDGDSAAAVKAFNASNPVERWATTERDEVRRVIEAAGRQPTHNYVVFDENTINILKKYGLAGLTAGAGSAAVLGSTENASAGTPEYRTGGRF